MIALICRRLNKLPDEVEAQPYNKLMRVWQFIRIADNVAADPDA